MDWISAAEATGQLLVGSTVGVFMAQVYENFRFLKDRNSGLAGAWLGEWQPLEAGREDEWDKGHAEATYRLGWLSLRVQHMDNKRVWSAKLTHQSVI
jgi:hypothetical protein